ncbi:MAG: aminoacyl-tRNA hydrolase [Gammaproteobacteria bacterium]|nr:aminoacyl-tRNA hydrolase [Gammaproteobacteria bacterium]
MIKIKRNIYIADDEVEFLAIRAQGAGGQNVNKVSSAIHLRFDVNASSLPISIKQRLLNQRDRRINKEGVIVVKAQRFRAQEKNRDDALDRLREIIIDAATVQKARRPTKPTKGSQVKRLDSKTKRARTKALRGKVSE